MAISTIASTAPSPAVSDGVANPPYSATITPVSRIRNGNTRGSASIRSRIVKLSARRISLRSPPPAAITVAAACSRFHWNTANAANSASSSTPGPSPARNSRPSDCSEATAYRISTMDGGSRMPSVPPAATSPAANPGE